MNGRIAAAAAAVALAGCGGTAHPHASYHPARVAVATPTARFMAAVQAAGLGGKDTTSPAVLVTGHAACRMMPVGLGPRTYRRLVRITARQAGATTYQARVLIDAAVRDLCPWARQFLPPAAP